LHQRVAVAGDLHAVRHARVDASVVHVVAAAGDLHPDPAAALDDAVVYGVAAAVDEDAGAVAGGLDVTEVALRAIGLVADRAVPAVQVGHQDGRLLTVDGGLLPLGRVLDPDRRAGAATGHRHAATEQPEGQVGGRRCRVILRDDDVLVDGAS